MRDRIAVGALVVSVLLAACAALANRTDANGPSTPDRAAPSATIFLVRHAEPIYPPPEGDPRNPRLNAMGQERADALARLLASAGMDRILSSDYHRTRETAAPLAEVLGLEVELYDPGDLPAVANDLLAVPGKTLVAGHSNTTPELVALLGGEPGEPIDEGSEFDRLYILTGSRDAGFSTVVLRYGDPVPANWKDLAGVRRP